MGYFDYVDVSVLLGKTLDKLVNNEDRELSFYTTDGKVYKMYHEQECCEYVYLADIVGDLDDLVGSPIVMAEKSSNRDYNEHECESQTWTFYKFATNKGYVTLRWYGTSNGYYSEGVGFYDEDGQ